MGRSLSFGWDRKAKEGGLLLIEGRGERVMDGEEARSERDDMRARSCGAVRFAICDLRRLSLESELVLRAKYRSYGMLMSI